MQTRLITPLIAIFHSCIGMSSSYRVFYIIISVRYILVCVLNIQTVEVDFTPPFKRISMIDELEKQLGVAFPSPATFASPGKFRFINVYSLSLY